MKLPFKLEKKTLNNYRKYVSLLGGNITAELDYAVSVTLQSFEVYL